ncbi:anion transporter [Sulfodiicoccus acidiphilus]|uniref:Anion transporter n=1 Tax=Sulfodiicoccus acidiphilus TaxID=1670455 RepID=A0A348B4J5_9CREN|nr:SLC13 family permease [Sulfodiicoccus acidiphilus]BBD73097.1 anion transporter [Sulfodiicoccus acidiphilus]GGU00797.1 anion transporter [Sulfodiicoccus acidiphilus]
MNLIGVGVVVLTFALIAARRLRVPPWASMLLGGVLMVALGVETFQQALEAVDLDVVLFLFSLFSLVSALEVSGFLRFLAFKLVSSSKDPGRLLLYTLVFSSLLACVVTNDGVASSWTPVVLDAARFGGVDSVPLMYSLAFGVTIGSTMMPTGNPQNLLIALNSGLPDPFVTFLRVLFLPTMINVMVTYLFLRLIFRRKGGIVKLEEVKVEDKFTAYLALVLLIATFSAYFVLEFVSSPGLNYVSASLLSASLLYLLSGKRRQVVRNLDWSTIVFFVGLFMFTRGVLNSGVVNAVFNLFPSPASIPSIMVISVLLSQVVSNVPLVALYIPVIASLHPGAQQWIALAVGSTIAGNVTLLGAASNVIISEGAEARGERGFDFLQFMKYGVPLTLVNLAVYYPFLVLKL